MSRSYKKEVVYKDPSNTEGKKHANRKLRRKLKQAIHNEDENMPLHMEVMNQYDVCDFKIRYDESDGEVYKQRKRK